uniref:Uncharacterized protein n=1 Tax=Ditylenchus dipsaci TaxID=166011 RepID=A0A915DBR4_9BILA
MKRNFQEIFGSNMLLWLIPVFTSAGDGVEYPQRFLPQASAASTMDSENSRYSHLEHQTIHDKHYHAAPSEHATFSTVNGGAVEMA